MATYPTLLDMAKRNARDRAVPLISETSKLIPEITGVSMGRTIPGVGSVRTIEGINYHTLVRTKNPTVDFRNANQGSQISAGEYENRLVETFILNPRWEADKAIADRSEDGPDAYIADEAVAIMEAAMQLLGKQFFYGRGTGSAKGHPGLVDMVSSLYTKSATGTAGQCSSVWFVKFGPADVQWVYGKNGLLTVPDKRIETVYRNSLPMDAYVQSLLAYPGVQCGSIRSIARLSNVSAEVGKTMTDTLGYQTLALMDVEPDVCFMNKTVLEQLRSSRTTFSPTGQPAPIPTDLAGVPIAVTQSLVMTE